MTVTSRAVQAINETLQGIPLTEKRVSELPVELNQLHGVAQEARASHDFDCDPADFRRTLRGADPVAAEGTPEPVRGEVVSTDDPTALGVAEVADAIAAGQISASDVLEAALARIERLDPTLHAFIHIDADAATERARALDTAQGRGERLGALHGVPMAHKDMFYRPERASTCGSTIRKTFHGGDTAMVLRRLDAAGAIDVGGLAMVEFAMGPHGYNAHLPRCRNTWDFERVPCGSSSGSGTAVAGRLVHAALGSDTGGSIRCPAAANGIVGLMPTYGRVSRYGAMPMSWSLDVVGPLARTVRDCARILRVIAGHDPMDATSVDAPVEDYEGRLEQSIRGLKIGVPRGYFDDDLDADVAAVVARSLDVLAECGAKLVPVAMPDFMDTVSRIHPLVMKAEGAANHGPWKRARDQDYSDEVGLRLQAGFFIPATDYINALQYRARVADTFSRDVFSSVDVLHTPVLPIPTPTLAQTSYEDGPRYLEMVVSLTRNTRVVNFFGLPALSVTCGSTSEGMPTSFQLVGPPFSEATLLRLGHRYQMETDWHERVPTEIARLS